jgi:hypothetical protein
MDLELVLNELSLGQAQLDVPRARQVMTQFVSVVRAAHRAGLRRSIRMEKALNDHLIAPDYPIARWRNDMAVEREERQYFRSVIAQISLLADLPEIQELRGTYEFRYRGSSADGLGVAHLISGLALSLETGEDWHTASVDIESSWIDENVDVVSRVVSVNHASRPEHIEAHFSWIRTRLTLELERGDQLWARRNELFPRLIFCDSVRGQIESLNSGNPVFGLLVRRLEGFNAYCEGWTVGGFLSERLSFHTRPESQPTLNQYRAEREFTCPDGHKRLFEWHCSLTSSQRVHFLPDPTTRTIAIGYVGRHLRTVRYG